MGLGMLTVEVREETPEVVQIMGALWGSRDPVNWHGRVDIFVLNSGS